MKTKDTLKRFGFSSLFLILFALCVGVTIGFCAEVNEYEAVANLWYAMELNSGYTKIEASERTDRLDMLQESQVLYLVSKDDLLDSPPPEGNVLAYVIKFKPTGFVVVAGDDRDEPIIAFSVKSQFRWDHSERNFLRYFLGRTIVSRQVYLRRRIADDLTVDVHPNWIYLRSRLQENKSLRVVSFEAPKEICVWDTALWDQGWPYNMTAVTNNGNNNVPTGCTATAMAIKMRFHCWPPIGSGSHSYDDIMGNVRFSHAVNFGAQTYNWAAMPTTSLTQANPDVADLMYHCGVAVDMNYEIGNSGAWPTAHSMNTYFGYKGTIDTGGVEAYIEKSIRGGLPVILCSSSHTVVADGWRNTMSPYFRLNCGWNGSSNGWYNLNQIPGGDPTIDKSYPYCSPSNNIYVDWIQWSLNTNGNIQTPYNTISEGYSAVPNGGHLWLKAGTYYTAPITFNKQMIVRSYEGTAIIQ